MTVENRRDGVFPRILRWFGSREVTVAPVLLVLVVASAAAVTSILWFRPGGSTQPSPAGREAILADPPSGATANPHGINAMSTKTPTFQDKKPVSEPKGPSPVVLSQAGCSGNDGRLSLLAVGQSDCQVTVGDQTIVGTPPFFRKECPSGRCRVQVRCGEARDFAKEMAIPAGGDLKVIIKPEDFR